MNIGIFSSLNAGNQQGPYTINTILHSHILHLLLGDDVTLGQSPNSVACNYPSSQPTDHSTYNSRYKAIRAWHPLEDYTGTYYSPTLGNITVYVNLTSRRLHMTYGLIRFRLWPLANRQHSDAFFAVADGMKWPLPDIPVSFTVDREGNRYASVQLEYSEEGIFVYNQTGDPFLDQCDYPVTYSSSHIPLSIYYFTLVCCVISMLPTTVVVS